MSVERAVDILLVAVKPVFRHAFRLRDPTEDASVAHLLVAEGNTEQIDAAPALHSLRCRLLAVAVARVAEAAGIGVARPGAEGAQPREALVAAIPVCIVLGDEFQHAAIFLAEIVVDKSQQRTGISVVAVMEMVVVEGVAVVTRVVAHKSAPAVVARKKALRFAGSIGEPVLQTLAQARAALLKEFFFAHLAGKGHVESHLRQSFAAPIGVGTKTALGGIVGNHLDHSLAVVGVGEVCHLLRRSIPRQEAVELISRFKSPSGSHLHLAARSGIGVVEEGDIVG